MSQLLAAGGDAVTGPAWPCPLELAAALCRDSLAAGGPGRCTSRRLELDGHLTERTHRLFGPVLLTEPRRRRPPAPGLARWN